MRILVVRVWGNTMRIQGEHDENSGCEGMENPGCEGMVEYDENPGCEGKVECDENPGCEGKRDYDENPGQGENPGYGGDQGDYDENTGWEDQGEQACNVSVHYHSHSATELKEKNWLALSVEIVHYPYKAHC